MTFPLSHTGTVRGPLQDLGALRKRLLDELDRLYARKVTWTDEEVTFRGGLFRLYKNRIGPISFGRIRFSQSSGRTHVEYHLRFTELVIVFSVFLTVPLVAFLHSSNGNTTPEEAIGTLAAFWVFVVGVNYGYAVFGFRSLIKRVVKS